MIVSRVVAHNILTYEDLDVSLRNLPGLNLIIGVVNDKAGSSSNGAGKTNLIETILWGLFGQTIRYGDSKTDFIRNERRKSKERKCRDYFAHIYIDDNDQRYRIERSKDGLSLYVNDQEDDDVAKRSKLQTQKAINQLLGTDFNAFLNTNIFTVDKVVAFASARDKDRNAIVDKILGLEVLAKCHKETKTRLKAVSSDIGIENNNISNTESLIDELVDDKEDACKKLEEEKKKVKANLDKLKKDKTEKEKEVSNIQSTIEKKENLRRKRKEEQEEKEEEYESKKEQLEEKLDVSKEQRTEIKSKINHLTSKVEDLTELIDSSKDLVGKRCPTCGTQVTDELSKESVEEYSTLISTTNKDINKLKADLETKKEEIETIKEQIKGIDTSELDAISEKLKAVKEEISNLKSDKRVAKTELRTINKEIKKANEAKPVYGEIVKDIESKIDKSKKVISTHKEKLKELQDKQALLQFWQEGFGSAGLKSYIIQNIKPELNRLANEYSQDLTDGSIRIEFDMQTKVRAGVVREKVDVKATNQFGANIYDGNSRGERTRIDIAILKALQRVSTNRRFDQDWFDEVTTNLDDFGGERFIRMLRSEINKEAIFSTFVISHLSAMKNNYDSIITCTKTNGISQVSIS